MSTTIFCRVWTAVILSLTFLAISENIVIAQCPPVGANTKCGTIITIKDEGFTVSHSTEGPYDTIDDTLVGIVNQSTKTISSIELRSGLPVFAFDGDGICGNSPLTGLPYIPRPPASACPPFPAPGSTGYETTGVSFTNMSSTFTEGKVNFSSSIAANGGTAYFSLEEAISSAPSCSEKIDHSLKVYTSAIGSRPNVTMNAEFTPVDGITAAANSCGFDKFNWISEITVPAPVTFWRRPTPNDEARRLLPNQAYNDPVQGGFTYDLHNPIWNSYPYYWDVNINNMPYSLANHVTGTTLKFDDTPMDQCLPTPPLPSSPGPECAVITGGSTRSFAAPNSKLNFTTRVVGIRNSALDVPVELGIFFKWESTFTGTVGGASRTANLDDPDPGIGTGGITITEVHDTANYEYNGIAVTAVNGVPLESTPPTITVSATPKKLWPPNHSMVPVTVSGTMQDAGGSGLNLNTAAYFVTDEYGVVEPKGTVMVNSDGSYLFTILLQASRDKENKDGRQYTITVSVEDKAGNKGSSSTEVIVPHDQGHERKHHPKHNREHDRGHDRDHDQEDSQKHNERGDREHDRRH
ncbi:MAG: hypothetical protein ABI604_07915 [Nitrospirota bacterium]